MHMSLKRSIAAMLFAVGILASFAANAIMITLDDYAPTVVRPSSGIAQFDFIGHIDISPGFKPGSIQASTLRTATGATLGSRLPIPRFDSATGTFALEGVLFSVFVSASDALGLYQFGNPELTSPSFIRYFECPITSGSGCIMEVARSATVNYSLNLVDAVQVPEPWTLALFTLGLTLAAFIRRSYLRTRPEW
jgi:hypothetical protein